MSTNATNPPFPTSRLWWTAAALAAACAFLVGRGWGSSGAAAVDPLSLLGVAPAQAGMVSHVGSLAVMTADVGNEEVLVVLDNRSEQLLVYRVENMSVASLVQRTSLARVFLDGRHRAQGRPSP